MVSTPVLIVGGAAIAGTIAVIYLRQGGEGVELEGGSPPMTPTFRFLPPPSSGVLEAIGVGAGEPTVPGGAAGSPKPIRNYRSFPPDLVSPKPRPNPPSLGPQPPNAYIVGNR